MKKIIGLMAVMILLLACSKGKPQQVVQKQAQPTKQAKTETMTQKPEEKKVEIESYAYDPKGRRDPFLSIIEASKKERETERKKKGLKPSEAFDVPDIRVIAIAKDRNKYYAMVQLPDKKYFTVREGMSLGLYGGKVIKIDAAGVVVREFVKNYKGEIHPKDTILKLRKEEEE